MGLTPRGNAEAETAEYAKYAENGMDWVPHFRVFRVFCGSSRLGNCLHGASPFPRQHRLELLSLYLHEQIGWWVYRWRGWVWGAED